MAQLGKKPYLPSPEKDASIILGGTTGAEYSIKYLTEETDPIWSASPSATITLENITNWDTAYGWGDHSIQGYLKVETDPIFLASPAYSITNQDILDWGNAYDLAHSHSNKSALDNVSGVNTGDNSVNSRYESLVTMTYPAAGIALSDGSAWLPSIIDNSSYWNTAYSWGDHAVVGYIADSDFTSQGIMLRGATAGTYSILTDNSSNWNTAYSWGDHSLAGYIKENETITLSGDVTGSGKTAITTSLSDNTVSAGKLKGTGATKLTDGLPGNFLISLGDGAFGWDTNVYLTNLDGAITDDDFTSNGIMVRTSAGVYGIITDSSANWDIAFADSHTHANKTALDSVSGVNTGDDSPNALYSGLVSNATHSGDVSGSTTLTINDNRIVAGMMRGASNTKLSNGTSGNLLKSLGDGTFGWDSTTYLTSESDPVWTAWLGTSRSANTVFAAPNGSAGSPSFRLLAASDIPALSYEPPLGNPAGDGYVLTSTTLGVRSWTFVGSGGIGNVIGPSSAVANNVVFFDGTTGKLIKDSGLTLSGTNTGDNAPNSLYASLVSFPGFGTSHSTAAYGDHTHSTYVPYTGATGNVDIGSYNLSTNAIQFAPNPTIGAFSNGKMFYDSSYGTIAVQLDADVTMQIGQETMLYAYNNTGTTIYNGKAVYINGVNGTYPTIALARADSATTDSVVGVATQDIPHGTNGYITVRGVVHDINTSLWAPGTVLYLSAITAGELTSTPPGNPNSSNIVGIVVVSDSTSGSIFVDIHLSNSLDSLIDVAIANPSVDQILKYNGAEWINAPATSANAGNGVEFFMDGTIIVPSSTENDYNIRSLYKSPITFTEVIGSINVTVANSPLIANAYLYNTSLGGTVIDAGTWTFNNYNAVSSTNGGRISSVTINTFAVNIGAGTATVTGTGTSRTLTASTDSPFQSDDANASRLLCSFIQTPKGIYQITDYTSPTVVTILVPTGYVNETEVSYNKWNYLFSVNTGAITSIYPTFGKYTMTTVQPSYIIAEGDKLGVIHLGISNNNTTIYLVRTGSERYTSFYTPLVVRHNDLVGLQGGSSTERYHLSLAQHTIATQAATGSLSGYLTSTDFNIFNGKQDKINGTGFVKANGTVISYDNSTYLTANQNISISGAVSGSGTTSIATTLANNIVGASNIKGSGGSLTNGTSGNLLKSLGDGTFAWDTNTYITGNQTITLSGVITGSGATSISTSISTNAIGASQLKGSGAALTNGSSGNLLKSLGDGTFAWDTNTYLTSISPSLSNIGNGTAANQILVTGASPYAPAWTLATNLASLNSLSYASASFVKMTAAGTFSLDTNTYLTSVTAHNLLSSTHGDTLADTVVRGDIIVGNSTPKWSRLAIGGSGRVIISNGTDVLWSTSALGTAAYEASTAFQPSSTNLTSLASLSYVSSSFVKMTAAGTFSLDTNTYVTGTPWTSMGYLTANQTITLSGDVSGSGSTSITTTIGANKVTLGMLTQVSTATFLGRNTAGSGNVEELSMATAKSMLGLGSAAYTNITDYAPYTTVSFPGFGTNHTTAAYGDHTHSGVYEPVLGNPAADGYLLSSTTSGTRSWISIPSASIKVTQVGHGFVAGDVIRNNGTANTFVKAQADSAANAEVVGIVTAVNGNDFTYITNGYFTAGVPSVVAGTVMFLSPTTPGALTATEPTAVNQISKPLVIVLENGAKASFNNFRGILVTGAGNYVSTSRAVNGKSLITDITLYVDSSDFTFSDNTTNNASASKHGLLPKLSGNASDALRGDGTWGAVSSGSAFWTLAAGTPTRASNTTFTVTGDYTSIFAKGLVIKWTESSAVKVAMVAIPSTYGSPNTTVTTIGDTMASIDAGSLKYCLVGVEAFKTSFNVAGNISVNGTNVANAFYATEPYRVIGADLQVGTAGTTNNTTVDINKNGTTMFTTKPTLATTVASSPLAFTVDSGTSLALGDKVTLDIDAVQTTPAIDLYVQLYVFPTRYLNL